MKERVHKKLLISGDVQGVFFRQSALQLAIELGITGWIQNDPVGTVSASVEGEAEKVRRFVEWCRSGPPSARVEDVLEEDLPAAHFVRFEIRR